MNTVEILKELLSTSKKEVFFEEIKQALIVAIGALEAIESAEEISLCPHCFCMTKNVCGKCKKIKEK